MIKNLEMIKNETVKKETKKIFFGKHGYMPESEGDWAEFEPTEEIVEQAYGIQLLLEIRRLCSMCPGVNIKAIIYKDLMSWTLCCTNKLERSDFITYLELMYQGLDENFDNLKVADFLSSLELAFTGDMKIADIYAIFF